MDEPETPVLNITGEKVALGPHRRDLVPLYQKWINDFEVTRSLSARLRPLTLEAETAWYEQAGQGDGDALFTIYTLPSLQPVGSTGLHHIDTLHGTAVFGILIGEKECWGQGYGTETARLMLDYGFTILGLHNIMLTVFSFNQRGIRAYGRAGFREFGRRRESFRLGGAAYDTIYMECLATEFRSPILHHLLPDE